MANDFLVIVALMAILSIVQSYFGMGILIFGTPILLLLGYQYPVVLSYLLPASFAISLLQVLSSRRHVSNISVFLYTFCLPAIFIGLWLTTSGLYNTWIDIIIGTTLVVSAVIRYWPAAAAMVSRILTNHLAGYHIAMGLVHGLTNLGGALLAILASNLSTDKEAVRYTIAHYYLAFSIVQMLSLFAAMGHNQALLENAYTALISSGVYLTIGNRIFARSNSHTFNTALTFFIAMFGAVLLLRP